MKETPFNIKSYFLFRNFILVLPNLLLLVSCSAVGTIIGGSIQTFTGTETITLNESKQDIFDTIIQVGKEMDLSVSGMDKNNQTISLSSGYGTTGAAMIGKQRSITITIILSDYGKRLDVTTMVYGNFSFGTKENADKIFNEFKGKLLSKIK